MTLKEYLIINFKFYKMKAKKDIKKYDVSKFEPLKGKGQKLIGGFSSAYTSNELNPIDVDVNVWKCGASNANCAGGNCVAGCGS